MNPIIKWPGGKSGEIKKIKGIIPPFDRYIEPFFGGGALFFHLEPKKALINDISYLLMDFYRFVKAQDKLFLELLLEYNRSFSNLKRICEGHYPHLHHLFEDLAASRLDAPALIYSLKVWVDSVYGEIYSGFGENLAPAGKTFSSYLINSASEKMMRTLPLIQKRPFSESDLRANLITGFTGGYYMYFRQVYNDINLGRFRASSPQYRAANFYFIREYCYGSMFRYNKSGEFNIPYGGMTYNKKNFRAKIENIFNEDVRILFKDTNIFCLDFEDFLEKAMPTERDFIFLDPPYDTDFSDYEGKDFTKGDQERLSAYLLKTPAPFILIIKNTEFIYDLYKDHFNIMAFDNKYTYNVKSRNERDVEHLIVRQGDVSLVLPGQDK